MFSCEFCETFKNTYFEEQLPTDASINEWQQESHALLGKKNESHLVNLFAGVSSLIKLLEALKKRLGHRCSLVNFCNIFKSVFLRNTSVRLPLDRIQI